MGKKARTLLVIGLLALVVTLGCIGRPKTTLTPEPTPTPTPSPEVEEQLDRAQAIDILVDEVIKPDTLDYNLIVFTLDEPLPQGAEVAAYAPDPLPDGVETLPYLVPETMTAPTWFFWIDDNPFDQFSHPTRFVFIDAENGDVEISYQGWWPYIDGEYISQWVDTEERWDSGNWAFSNVPADEIPQKTTATRIGLLPSPIMLFSLIDTLYWDMPRPSALSNGEAMVHVNGWTQGQTEAGFSDDMTNASAFGTNAQIPKYMPQGDTKADIENAIKRAKDAGADDIFFYYTGHGGRTDAGRSYLAFRNTAIYPDELAEIFKKFCTVRFKVVLQGCYLGGFADTLMNSCKVDIFLSAARADETSAADWDPKDAEGNDRDVNPDDTGSEYSSGLWEDLEEIRQSEELQERARKAIEGKGFDEFVGWLSVANTSAIAKDVDVKLGYTHPVGKMKSKPCPEPEPPVTETPPLPPVETVMDVILTRSLTLDIDEEGEFTSEIAIEIVALDLTRGDYPITKVTIDVNDETWLASGDISTDSYEGSIEGAVEPGSFFDIYVLVTNEAGLEMEKTETVEVPETAQLSLPLAMGAQSVSDETGCRSTLTISYSATLISEADVTVTQVILKVNGDVWIDAGNLSTTDYHNVVEKPADCGQTFNAEIIATTSDGLTFTTAASLTTPIPE